MTLGGLALAIGLLVDNATVVIENIHRNLMLGKKLTIAILDGASEVIQPLTVATLAICIVFFPVVMLFGVARYLFIPFAATVVFCMLASYALSFTVVPSFARLLLGSDKTHHAPPKGFFGLFDRGFDRFRRGYGWMLDGTLRNRAVVLTGFVLLLGVTGAVATTIGLDFFPSADVGLIKMHYRGPAGNPHRGNRKTGAAGRASGAGQLSRPPNSIRSTILSACRRHSTWPSCPATMSARWTPRS